MNLSYKTLVRSSNNLVKSITHLDGQILDLNQ